MTPRSDALDPAQVSVGDRTLPAARWEGEALVHAAAWVLLLRGLGLGVAATTSAIACLPPGMRQLYRVAGGWGLALTCTAIGVGLLQRRAACRRHLVMTTLLWVVLILMDLPRALGVGGAFALGSLRAEPIALIVLPSFVAPELFALYAIFRRDGRAAFRERSWPLASSFASPCGVESGRVLAARGMIVLAVLSDTLLVLFGPALLLTMA